MGVGFILDLLIESLNIFYYSDLIPEGGKVCILYYPDILSRKKDFKFIVLVHLKVRRFLVAYVLCKIIFVCFRCPVL